MTVTETIALCKKILVEHYGAQFRGLLLCGSTARGQATPDPNGIGSLDLGKIGFCRRP